MKFACPSCGQHIECGEHLAGKKASCPTCKQAFLIPGASTPAPSGRKPSRPPVTRKSPSTTKPLLSQRTVTVLALIGIATATVLIVGLCLQYIRPSTSGTNSKKTIVTSLKPSAAGSTATNPAPSSPPATPAAESPSLPPTAKVDTNIIPAPTPSPATPASPVQGHPLRDTSPNIQFTPNYDGSQYASVAKIENGLAAVEDKWIEAGQVQAAHSKGSEIWCFEIIVGDSGTVTSKDMNVTVQQFVLTDLDEASHHGNACREQQGGELRRSEKLRIIVCFEVPARSTPKQLVWNPPIVFASTRQPAQCNSQWLAKKEIFQVSKTSGPAAP